MSEAELEELKAQIKTEGKKLLIKTARDMRKILAVIDAELQSRKGQPK